MAQDEELQFVRQAKAGSSPAFATIAEMFWDRIYRWLYGLTHSQHLAEDLTQEVFLRAWKQISTLKSAEAFRPWLFRIARNCFRDLKKSPASTPMCQLPADAYDHEPEPLSKLLNEERQVLLRDACSRLPIHFRAALLLWTQEELSYAEIAHVLGTTEETARWRVFKARRKLLKDLGTDFHQESP